MVCLLFAGTILHSRRALFFSTQKSPEFRILHIYFQKFLGQHPKTAVEGATPSAPTCSIVLLLIFPGIILALETTRARSQPFGPRSLIAFVFSLSSIRPIVFSHVARELKSLPTPDVDCHPLARFWFCSFRLWRFINHLLTYLLTWPRSVSSFWSSWLLGTSRSISWTVQTFPPWTLSSCCRHCCGGANYYEIIIIIIIIVLLMSFVNEIFADERARRI